MSQRGATSKGGFYFSEEKEGIIGRGSCGNGTGSRGGKGLLLGYKVNRKINYGNKKIMLII